MTATTSLKPGQSITVGDRASAYMGRTATVRCLYEVAGVVVATVGIPTDGGEVVFALRASQCLHQVRETPSADDCSRMDGFPQGY